MAIFATQDYKMIISETGQDLSTASTLKIRARKPDDTTFEQVATAEGTGNADAFINITGAVNDLAGKWFFQVEAIISSKTYLSDTVEVTVERPIIDPSP